MVSFKMCISKEDKMRQIVPKHKKLFFKNLVQNFLGHLKNLKINK